MTWLIISIIVALVLTTAAIAGAFSKHQRCYWKTGHNNREALGSVDTHSGPRFLYCCKDCGIHWSESWS